MNTFKNCLWKLVVIAVVLMMVISGISNARSVYAVGENTQQTIVNQNETAPQTSEKATQENTKEGTSGTSVSASENEKVEEKTDADQSTGLDPPATTENKTDTVEMPEASFTASTDKLIISVTALANTFPKGTKMEAKEISVSDAKSIAKEKLNNIDEAVGADITFSYEGKEIEPANDKNVTVKMTLKNEMDGKNFQVLHKKDSGDIEKMTADVSGKKAIFKAKSFSIYVITSEQVDTYRFYDESGNVMDKYTQMITDKEALDQPNAPEKDGYKFIGWSKDPNGSKANFDFNHLPTRSGTTFDIYPVFQEVHYVFFMAGATGDDATKVAVTKEGVKGKKITADEISKVKLGLASNQSIEGWYYDQALKHKVDSIITISDQNISLYPKIQTGYHITFDSDGGTYFEPRFVEAGKRVEKSDMPDKPEKKGYTFSYWSESKNGLEYTYGKTLDKDLKLYAVYEAAMTTYSVVYWIESTDDRVNNNGVVSQKTYEVQDTVQRTAKTDTKVHITNADIVKYTKGVRYNKDKTDQEKIVRADGKTVLNVYFDRKIININFHFGGSIELNRYYYYYASGYDDSKTLSYYGVYGAKFNNWPDGQFAYLGDGTNGERNEKMTNLTFLDSYILPNPDNTVIHLFSTEDYGSKRVEFYLETLNGGYKCDKTYYLSGDFYITDKYNGFKAYSYNYTDTSFWGSEHEVYLNETPNSDGVYAKVSDYNYKNLKIYFKRNSYNLIYHNNNELYRTELVKYEDSLLKRNYTLGSEARPTSLDEEYTFQGWYKDEECTVPFDFRTKMPAHAIDLYAKWEAPDVKVTVHGLDEGNTQSMVNLPFRSKIDINNLPTVKDSDGTVVAGNEDYTYTVPSGSHWVGWATKDDNGNYTLFNFDTELKKDLNLYPYVIDSNKYVVSYVVNGDTDTVTDDKKYALNSFADVKSAKGIKPPDGTMFLNWQVCEMNGDGTKGKATGETLYPGDKLKMTGSRILVAQYVPIPQKVILVYHANNGTNTPELKHTVNGNTQFDNNDKITLYEGTEFTAPTDRKGVKAVFDSWNTNADGSGTPFEAGQKVRINKLDTKNTGTNNLYAQWKYVADLKISNSVTGNQGDKTKYFAFNVVIKNVKANTEYVLDTYNATDKRNLSSVTSNDKGEIRTTVYLKDAESIIFKDVNITNTGATYAVTENNETGYTTTYKLDDGAETPGVETSTNGFQKSHTVAFTNKLNGSIPTGIQSNTIITIPLLIAGIGFVLRMFKNRNDGE